MDKFIEGGGKSMPDHRYKVLVTRKMMITSKDWSLVSEDLPKGKPFPTGEEIMTWFRFKLREKICGTEDERLITIVSGIFTISNLETQVNEIKLTF